MKTLIILIISLFSGLLFAEDVSVLSRNMPTSCDYVFTVESDLRIEIPLNSLDQEIFFELQNSWTPSEWTKARKLELKALQSKLVGDLSFVSMSIPQKYLYRIISITFPKAKLKCISEFGREFGEACMPGGRSQTPWRTRQVKCETLP